MSQCPKGRASSARRSTLNLLTRLTVEKRGDTLVVTSHAYAKQVWLESEDADLLLDDNAFDMNPGTKVVRVVRGTAEKVRGRSVWDLGR